MKRLVFFFVACGTILFVTVVSVFLASPYVHASRGDAIQMLSGTFNDQNLSVDGVTKVTLISIPFSVTASTSKLEVTNFMEVNPNGAYGYVTCELDIDNLAFFSASTNIPGNSENINVGLTSTTNNITLGSHIFVVKCLGYAQYGQGSYSIHSRGTSVIIK